MALLHAEVDSLSLIQTTKFPTINVPVIDLSKPNSKTLINAWEDFGIVKVINHGVRKEVMTKLESEALDFFSLSVTEKESVSDYTSRKIGPNGDAGWVEHLMSCTLSCDFLQKFPSDLRPTVGDYVFSVRNLAIEVLQLLAEGLEMEEKNVFSKYLIDDNNDTIFRINHYPLHSDVPEGHSLLGFGEHTDPQIISIIGSNDVEGFQISLNDGSWGSVSSDPESFYIIVDDLLEVITNGRFKSLSHRTLANGSKDRLSMIYFGGPPLTADISPLISIMEDGEESKYKEFTWEEYKKAAFKSKLTTHRLGAFEIE
ncbi:hypothetical protein GIB67_026223 [Kingdonia uniflora]|uniref:Fe2OG dioxygenase domain-containing protein n=1 Tax=Kingdonia uniflora TaxID=39325 RepID=A0A7J7L9Q2_9MAGN|nr:hypothetical protein GIB67_026223 [Kingdonia uniflora]